MCEGPELITTSGTILTSPGYSMGNYPSNKNCETLVLFEEKTFVRLDFLDAYNIRFSTNCNYNFIEIRNGRNESSPLVMKACDTNRPYPLTLQGNSALIRFGSDHTYGRKGFKLKATQVADVNCKYL